MTENNMTKIARMSEPSELEYAWSIAEARNERICQVLEDNLALRARVAQLEVMHRELAQICWEGRSLDGGELQDLLGVPYNLLPPEGPAPMSERLPVCDCCQREVPKVRGSIWHGQSLICLECFAQWYDPDNAGFDHCNPVEVGNYVRKKHGLPTMDAPQ